MSGTIKMKNVEAVTILIDSTKGKLYFLRVLHVFIHVTGYFIPILLMNRLQH